GAERLPRLLALQEVQGFVEHDPIDPAEELVLRVIACQLLPGLEEGVLRDVPGVLVVVDHAQRHVEEDPLIPGDQRLEGLGVALDAPGYQLGLVLLIHKYTPPVAKVGELPARYT